MTKRTVYNHVARLYDLLDLPFEYGRYRPLRRAIWRDIEGRVLDAGVGTGRNMPFYPVGEKVTGIDLSPAMLVRAGARRDRLKMGKVDLHEMDVLETTFPDAHFDVIVSTFLFCVLDDSLQLGALQELNRICKPDGEIRILEYAYSNRPFKRFIMALWAPWVKFMYGATFNRQTEQYADEAGLELVEEQFLYQDIIKMLVLKPKSR
ncbi:MAG: class I SAM-dependent methyltransferase [Rhodospirillales bacterium]|nr:class I SAM-dependent methyltransferase [Rhodospirillales bacterium]